MTAIGDFFSPDAGQRRRRWLNEQDDRIGDALRYYLGPTADRVESAAQLGQIFNPVEGVGEAMAGGGLTYEGWREGDKWKMAEGIGRSASGIAGTVAPLAGASGGAADDATRAIVEALTAFSPARAAAADDLGRFAMDESGALSMVGGVETAPGAAHQRLGDFIGPMAPKGQATVNMSPGSRPEYLGAAPNRTVPYPRYEPKKPPPRMERVVRMLEDDGAGEIFDETIMKGESLGGRDWYNTEELRDWFIDELGPKEGDAAWRDYIGMVGATSTGSSVPSNLRNASFYFALSPADRAAVGARVKALGQTPADAARDLGVAPQMTDPAYNYGHVMQRNHGGNVVNYEAGLWRQDAADNLTGTARSGQLKSNPKVKGFANDLLGDDTNIAADKHFMRLLAMRDGGVDFLQDQYAPTIADLQRMRDTYGDAIEPYIKERDVKGKPVTQINLAKAVKDGVITDTKPFSATPGAWVDTPKDTEYLAYEQAVKMAGARYGMTPAQFQAALWMGAGDLTGLADESQGTFMELFRRVLDQRADRLGWSREEALKKFLQGGLPLSVLLGMNIDEGTGQPMAATPPRLDGT